MAFYEHKNGVSFRKVDESDLSHLLELKNESWFGTVNTACLNMADQKKWFEKISNDRSCCYFIADHFSSNSGAGMYAITGIDTINQSCDFSHSVYSSFRGQGLGKKTLRAAIDMTFEVFNMRRIETWVLSNNQAEIKTVTGVGFVEEGCKRKAVYKCGEYLDCKLFGLLRSEWDASLSVIECRNQDSNKGVCNLSYYPKKGP